MSVASMEQMHSAIINRSIRTIKAELEYLCDASIITPQTLSDLLTRIPAQTALHAPLSVGAVPTAQPLTNPSQPPTSPLSHLALNNSTTTSPPPEKQPPQQDSPHNPPPAYNPNWPPTTPAAPPLPAATALYTYTPTDAGDLPLHPHDRIFVLEYLNAEWWRGRCARTGQEGIFPRSYVRVDDEKAAVADGAGYGNLPVEVSGMGDGAGKVPGKGQEMGKKFGKKLGNAAIFGAGATIGGSLVNSIL